VLQGCGLTHYVRDRSFRTAVYFYICRPERSLTARIPKALPTASTWNLIRRPSIVQPGLWRREIHVQARIRHRNNPLLSLPPPPQQKYHSTIVSNPTATSTPTPIPTFSLVSRYPLGKLKESVGTGTTVDSAARKRIWIGVAVTSYAVSRVEIPSAIVMTLEQGNR
jgi:hypothetical protein